MKWTHEPGEPFPVLALNQNEAKILADVRSKHARGEVRRRYLKYKDLHDIGESTDRQEDLMMLYEERLNLTDRLLAFISK